MKYSLTFSAQSLCLFTMQPKITQSYSFITKPTKEQIDKLKREFALKNNVELDMIQINLKAET